jgi:phenylpropionate dioxygenase-like ring-hydroxylating dioxygenase large terminal subunit
MADEPRFPYPANPNGWFRVAYADELAAGQVLPLSRLGAELVLYRDEAGRAHVLDAYCPHLGAHLGHGGCVEGDALRCPFHAWLWGPDGSCREIRYAKKVPPRAKLRTWPVRERNGIVFVWHHDRGAEPDWEIPELSEVGSDAWTPLEVRRWTVRSRWLDMNENAVDKAHFRYVHGTPVIPESDVRAEGHVFTVSNVLRMTTPRGDLDATLITTDHGPGFQTVHITGGVDTLMLNTSTPIDADTTDVSFAYTVRRSPDGAHERVGAARIRDLEKQFEQDRPIWEHKTYHARPLLCDGDGDFGAYRRWMRQFFSGAW